MLRKREKKRDLYEIWMGDTLQRHKTSVLIHKRTRRDEHVLSKQSHTLGALFVVVNWFGQKFLQGKTGSRKSLIWKQWLMFKGYNLLLGFTLRHSSSEAVLVFFTTVLGLIVQLQGVLKNSKKFWKFAKISFFEPITYKNGLKTANFSFTSSGTASKATRRAASRFYSCPRLNSRTIRWAIFFCRRHLCRLLK
jgi:hypothetical protein